MSVSRVMPDKMRVAKSFGNAAASYDRFAQLQRDIADMLFARLAARPARRILDLGSGTGYCANHLRAAYPDATVTSLDIAEAMLVRAKSGALSSAGHFVCADAEALPLADAGFDLVLSNLTLQWCQDPARVFRELHRVMQPGACALVSTLAEHTLQELKDSWRQVDGFVHVNNFLPLDALERAVATAPFSRADMYRSRETWYYGSLGELTRELKGIGAHNLNAGQASGLTGRDKLARLKRAFESRHVPGQGIPVTYDLVIMRLVK